MSEVKLNTPAISTGHPDAGRVYAAAYEAAVVAHDAQRLRADTAEAEVARLREAATLSAKVGAPNFHSMKRELAAAEQRIAELSKALLGLKIAWVRSPMSITAPEYQAACAALNPNPEAESHKSALKFYPPGKCPECDKGVLKANNYRYECDTCEFNCGEGDHDQ